MSLLQQDLFGVSLPGHSVSYCSPSHCPTLTPFSALFFSIVIL
jgi:hypothetical protein